MDGDKRAGASIPVLRDRRRELRTILAIEDNDTFSQMLIDIFPCYWKDEPMPSLLVARSMRTAIEALRTNRVDLIILDLHLPDFHGTDAVSSLMAALGDQAYTKPIVVLSGFVDDVCGMDLLGQGVQEYVHKPGPDLFPRLVKSITSAWARHRHLEERFAILRLPISTSEVHALA
jgi:DNA-binding response OmpR family regulator